MRISPIKSIIRNLTDQKFTTPVNSGLRIVVTAKNTPGDTAKIVGDVFTLMNRTDVVEAFAGAIIDGRISLEYVVDGIAKITTNTATPNINSSVSMQERIKNFGKTPTATVETPKAPEKPAEKNSEKQEQGVEEPSKEADKGADKAQGGVDTCKQEATDRAPVSEPPKEADKAPEKPAENTPAKPQRKQRQIKLN